MKRPSSFQARSGAKRLVIKNLRQLPRASPREYFDRTWVKLDESLSAIFAGQKAPHSIEELYRGVENICRQELAGELFEKMSARIRDYLEARVQRPLRAKAAMSCNDQAGRRHVELLSLMHAAWLDWNAKLVTCLSSTLEWTLY